MKEPWDMTPEELEALKNDARAGFAKVQEGTKRDFMLFVHAMKTMDRSEQVAVMSYVQTLIAFIKGAVEVYGMPVTFDGAQVIPLHPDDAEMMSGLDA